MVCLSSVCLLMASLGLPREFLSWLPMRHLKQSTTRMGDKMEKVDSTGAPRRRVAPISSLSSDQSLGNTSTLKLLQAQLLVLGHHASEVFQELKSKSLRTPANKSASVSEEHHVQHARWIQEEMPVRLAHRLSDFLQLPFVIVCNARFHEVFRLFLHAFETLVESPPVKDAKDVEEFAKMLRSLVNILCQDCQEGYAELHALLEDLVELEEFLNQTCFTRIGNRVLAEHFLACCPSELVSELSESLGDLCDELFGRRPKVNLEGELDTQLSFVPEHLRFMLQEILKNSFRATLEVTVEVLKGIFDVTIKVSDRGGGMRPEELRQAWRYGHSCATKPSVDDDFQLLCGRDAASMRQLAGYGFGLPLSRVYAQYFGGDIHVQSMHGFGTDVYLNVNHLGDVLESDGSERHVQLVAARGLAPERAEQLFPKRRGRVPSVQSAALEVPRNGLSRSFERCTFESMNRAHSTPSIASDLSSSPSRRPPLASPTRERRVPCLDGLSSPFTELSLARQNAMRLPPLERLRDRSM
eukprot:g31382.t1